MKEQPDIGDFRDALQQMKQEILKAQRESTILTLEKTDRDKSEIIAAVFSESKKIREKIEYQTLILKTLEDNLSELQFDEGMGVSSKIEVSVGADIFGTGAKWVMDINVAKASYRDILETILLAPGIPEKVRQKATSKLQKLLKKAK